MNSAVITQISECFLKPKHFVQESNNPYYLTSWDLSMLSFHYIQKGLLFVKPSGLNDKKYSIDTLLESLKDSLSIALVHFYPLAGQLSIKTDDDKQNSLVFIDCNKGPGARFIQASLDLAISDLITPGYVPQVVHSLFDCDRAVNFDGHARPLLSVQVTELLDGVFIGCSINHAVVDGTSYWHFWNTWSKIHTNRASVDKILGSHLRPPTENFPATSLPFTQPEEVLCRYEAPPLKERFFHFSSQSIARLKSNGNHDNKTDKISSFQALSAFVWKSIVKATCRPDNEVTNCRLANNLRHKLDPPMPYNYFGNCVNVLNTSITVDELLKHELGWVASRLNQSIVNCNDRVVREELSRWSDSPTLFRLDMLDSYGITMSSSPRFDMYGNEFGLGKAVAVRSGCANKFAGGVTTYPGREGGGSVDLEICLPPVHMNALELDEEFKAFIASNN